MRYRTWRREVEMMQKFQILSNGCELWSGNGSSAVGKGSSGDGRQCAAPCPGLVIILYYFSFMEGYVYMCANEYMSVINRVFKKSQSGGDNPAAAATVISSYRARRFFSLATTATASPPPIAATTLSLICSAVVRGVPGAGTT